MKTEIKNLDSRLQKLGNGPELPGWMRGMECLFGKHVVHNLLRMAHFELTHPTSPEEVNKIGEAETPNDDGGMDFWTMKEAITDRKWFMQNGKVEDALTRLCGVEGEITVESVEKRLREVEDAISQQYTRMDAEIAAREGKSR